MCAVFAESEVINHLSQGAPPADIMHGAIVSLVDRSVQLMKRVQMEPEFTLVGGILRFETMARVMREQLKKDVNVPPGRPGAVHRRDRRGDTGAAPARKTARRRRRAQYRDVGPRGAGRLRGACGAPAKPGA